MFYTAEKSACFLLLLINEHQEILSRASTKNITSELLERKEACRLPSMIRKPAGQRRDWQMIPSIQRDLL